MEKCDLDGKAVLLLQTQGSPRNWKTMDARPALQKQAEIDKTCKGIQV